MLAFLLIFHRKWVLENSVIHINDSDVTKLDDHQFKTLGSVCDGSASSSSKGVYKKGYHVTEVTALTSNNPPVSLFSKIHSSEEKNFTSVKLIKVPLFTELQVCNSSKNDRLVLGRNILFL